MYPICLATRHSMLLAFVALAFNASPVSANDEESPVTKINNAAAKAPVTVQSLRGNISELDGSGGNITVLSGPDGKFLVDAGIAISKDRIKTALAQISPQPVTFLVNTHWHWDHTDGNPWLHDEGATIIATANTKKHLEATSRVDDWRYTFLPLPAGGLPTTLVAAEKTYEFDGETIIVSTIANAHTDGDLYVYFKKADVLALGDTFWNGIYPFIDNKYGGSIDGTIRSVNMSLALATDQTIIVPGHGPVGTRAQLAEFRDMLVTVRTNVAKLKKQGKTLADTIAAHPTAAFDGKWGQSIIDPAFFTRLVYNGI